MRSTVFAFLAAALAATGLVVRAADEKAVEGPAPKAVVEEAIKAAGGKDNLAKLATAVAKSKGTLDVQGVEVAFTAEMKARLPGKARTDLILDVQGQKVPVQQVVVGDKAWTSIAGDKTALEGDLLADAQEEVQGDWYNLLYPLLDGDKVKLSPLGESKVGDKEVVGVKVEAKDHQEVSLYFEYSGKKDAKKVGLLVKSVRKGFDAGSGKKDAVRETLYSDYKVADGAQYPGKIVLSIDGKKTADVEVVELKPAKLEDKEFAEP